MGEVDNHIWNSYVHGGLSADKVTTTSGLSTLSLSAVSLSAHNITTTGTLTANQIKAVDGNFQVGSGGSAGAASFNVGTFSVQGGNLVFGESTLSITGSNPSFQIYDSSGGGDIIISGSEANGLKTEVKATFATGLTAGSNHNLNSQGRTTTGDISARGIIKANRINVGGGKLYVDDETTNNSVKIGAYGQGTFFGKDGSVNGAQYTLAVGSAGKIVEDLEVKTFKITGDGFLNLHTNPKTLIPSPGAGKAIICHHVSFYVDAGSVKGTGVGGFDQGGQNCYSVIQCANQTYTTSSVVYPQGGLPRNVLVGMTGDFIWTGEPEGDFRVIPDRALLLQSTADNNITVGNTAAKPDGAHYIKIRYQIVNISGDFQNIAGLTEVNHATNSP